MTEQERVWEEGMNSQPKAARIGFRRFGIGGSMEQEELERIVNDTLDRLYERDTVAIRANVAERTLCGRLAALLQPHFGDHDVHPEYNRHGVDPKEIELPNEQGVLTANRVSPDIVVHQAGHDRENLLVIEAKKTTNVVADDADLWKLEQIKRQIGYRFALFLRLPAGPGAARENVRLVWVE